MKVAIVLLLLVAVALCSFSEGFAMGFLFAAQQEAESDSESFDCGMAYTSGSPNGVKQCVTVQGKPVVVATAAAFGMFLFFLL